MSAERVERRLAAILAADVAGYSRLMGGDEEGTLSALRAIRRDLCDPKIAEHRGRIVKTTGDGLLVEFASVIDAVRCSVEVQREMMARNATVPAVRRIAFRMGINVGDIIIDEGDIFGDGVNVAARLEALAEPGGICVSARVQEDVAGKLDLAFQDIGEQALKNIARPVRAYRVRIDPAAATAGEAVSARGEIRHWAAAIAVMAVLALAAGVVAVWGLYPGQPAPSPTATVEGTSKTSPALPEKPSIAVLPLANMTGDPAQDYLADGLAENLIDALAQNPALFVVSRYSTLVYRGKAAPLPEVGKDLGVRYVLEGSVQKSGDRIRVTAQLIEAATNYHLLSEKYDRNLTDLFALEDDLTLQIVRALDARLSGRMVARTAALGTHNLDAWKNLVKARRVYLRYKPAEMDEAQKLAQRAVDLDPEYASAWQLLAFTYFNQADNGWAKDRVTAFGTARQLNDKVLQLDPEFAAAHRLRALLAMRKSDREAALADARKSIELGPNDEDNYFVLGTILFSFRRFDEATAELATALRLNPHPRIAVPGMHAVVLSASGHHDQAIAEIDAAIAADPENPFGFLMRGRVEAYAGHHRDAAASFEKALELDPASAIGASALAGVYNQLGRTDDAIRLLERGPPQWRDVPTIREWRALSYALAGRNEEASVEFAAIRSLASKYYTVASADQRWRGFYTPEFCDRIEGVLLEYGVPPK